MDFTIVVNGEYHHIVSNYQCVAGKYGVYEDIAHEYGDKKYLVCDKSLGCSKSTIIAAFNDEKDALAFCAYKNITGK